MNRDKVAEAVKDKAGGRQQKAGTRPGSSDRQAKAVAKQSEARVQAASDTVKAALRNARHS